MYDLDESEPGENLREMESGVEAGQSFADIVGEQCRT